MRFPNEYVLFTAADTTTMLGKSLEDFEINLIHNVLFEDKIVLHDSYLANSPMLYEHIAKYPYGLSLFEIAALNSLVAPAFRDSNTASLSDGIKKMGEDYGKDYTLEIQRTDKQIARRLFEYIDKGGHFLYWSEGANKALGETYEELLRGRLQNDKQPGIDGPRWEGDILHVLWKKTEKWRTSLIDEAAENTKSRGRRGIQRLEIYQRLCRDLGIAELADLKAAHHQSAAANAFMRWVSQCQQLNMAGNFGSSLNLLDYDLNEDFVADDMLKAAELYPVKDTEPLICRVNLPTDEIFLKQLRRDPQGLISIRLSYGKDYLESLKTWRSLPTDKNKRHVAELLEKYCDEISDVYSKEVKPPQGVAIIKEGMNIGASVIADPVWKKAAGYFVKVLGHAFSAQKMYRPGIAKTNLHIYHRPKAIDTQV